MTPKQFQDFIEAMRNGKVRIIKAMLKADLSRVYHFEQFYNVRKPPTLTDETFIETVLDAHKMVGDPRKVRSHLARGPYAVQFELANERVGKRGRPGGTRSRFEHKDRRGRPSVSNSEAEKRERLIQQWQRAKTAGICQKDFCRDGHVELQYLTKCLNWAAQRRLRKSK